LSYIGLRKGRRRAIHTPGRVARVEEGRKGLFTIVVEKLDGGLLCKLESEKPVAEKTLVWLALALVEGESRSALCLAGRERSGEREMTVLLEGEGEIRRARVSLDWRGRAEALEPGRRYLLHLLDSKSFFTAYERRSIPAGAGGRSEPELLATWRMRFFSRFADRAGERFVLDAATGVKSYLKAFAHKGSRLCCLNISLPMLRRTREWLGEVGASYVQYDANTGFPFKRSSFDLVLADALLEYVDEPGEVLKGCGELLKIGGLLLLLEPIASSEAMPSFYPQDLWELAIWRPRVESRFSRDVFQKLLEGEGFELLERSSMSFTYGIYSQEEFSQSAAAYRKVS